MTKHRSGVVIHSSDFMMHRRRTLEDIVQQLRQARHESDSDSSSDSDNSINSDSESNSSVPDADVYQQSSDCELYSESDSSTCSEEDSDSESTDQSPTQPIDSSDGVIMDNQDVVSPSGIVWKFNAPPSRRLRRNVINFREGPTVNPSSESEAFLLFIDEQMIRTSLRYTNRRLLSLRKRKFSYDEFKAGIGAIIRAGVDRDNMSGISALYNPTDSRPFFRCAISSNRLKLLLSHITFDNKVTRRDRQMTDKLAAVREFWDLFSLNLRKYYVPSSTLTVDEQLYAYRGYSPGRSYMPQKPAKYGIKTFWICDSKNGYALKALPYSGSTGTRAVGLAKNIVLQLAEPYFQTHRNIVTDRYFTSFELCTNLLENGLTMTGTIVAARREVPQIMKTTRSIPVLETRNLWHHEHRVLLSSYAPKRNKNVLLLSSQHASNAISTRDDKKPTIILDYNAGKGGVDVMDARVEDFTCRRKTRRYPLLHFFNMIDVALVNAFLIMSENGYTKSRSTFIKCVARQLADENINRRYNDKKIYAQAKHAFTAFGICPPASERPRENNKPRKCQVSQCRKSTRRQCIKCLMYVCSIHHIDNILCLECV